MFNKPEVLTSISNAYTWTKLVEYTFYLPTNSYTYIEGYGLIANWQYYAGTLLEVDGVNSTTRWYGDGSSADQWTGFSNPKVQYLIAG